MTGLSNALRKERESREEKELADARAVRDALRERGMMELEVLREYLCWASMLRLRAALRRIPGLQLSKRQLGTFTHTVRMLED